MVVIGVLLFYYLVLKKIFINDEKEVLRCATLRLSIKI